VVAADVKSAANVRAEVGLEGSTLPRGEELGLEAE
jgi:hypothetical protein